MAQHSDYIGASQAHPRPHWRRYTPHAQDAYGPGSVDPRTSVRAGHWNSPDLGGNFGGPIHRGSMHVGTMLTYGLLFGAGWFVGKGGLKKYLK